jgi:hypothetical protein
VRDTKIEELVKNIKKNNSFLSIPNICFYEINKRRNILKNFMGGAQYIKSLMIVIYK